jgi:hypothetical protein
MSDKIMVLRPNYIIMVLRSNYIIMVLRPNYIIDVILIHTYSYPVYCSLITS